MGHLGLHTSRKDVVCSEDVGGEEWEAGEEWEVRKECLEPDP